MAKKYKMVMLTRPVEGREEEYNDWYQNIHLHQMVSIMSFVGAQRFRLHSNMIPGTEDPAPYLAIYEIETDDIGAVYKAMQELATSGQMSMSDAMQPSDTIGAVYEEFGDYVKS